LLGLPLKLLGPEDDVAKQANQRGDLYGGAHVLAGTKLDGCMSTKAHEGWPALTITTNSCSYESGLHRCTFLKMDVAFDDRQQSVRYCYLKYAVQMHSKSAIAKGTITRICVKSKE